MSRFVFDSLIVGLLLLVCVALISSDGDSETRQEEMNAIITDFEDSVNSGKVVNDGYGLEDPIISYEGNGVSNIVSSIGSFIVEGANYGVDVVIKVIKMVLA